jgi:hypothetical protein
VTCEHDDESAFPQYFSGAVEIELRDGRRLARCERIHRGADARPLSPGEIERKFHDNATRAISRPQAERVREAVASLERAPDLVELCEALGA